MTWHGLMLLCLTGVLWGTIGPVVHVVHDRSGLSVLVVGGYRAVAAVGTLLLVAGLSGRLGVSWRLLRRDWHRVGAVGVLTASFQILFFLAVVSAGVSVTTVVALGVAPVLLLALGSVRQRRLPSASRSLTVAVALVGLVLVVLPAGAGGGRDLSLGVLAAVASGAAYGLAADVASPLSRRHDAVALTTATTVVAAAVLVPVGLLAAITGAGPSTTPDAWSWGLVTYLGVVTLALAYLLLYAGLRSTPSGTAVVATLLEPVTAVLIAVLLLGEALTVPVVVGSLLIISAIAGLGRQLEDPQPQ